MDEETTGVAARAEGCLSMLEQETEELPSSHSISPTRPDGDGTGGRTAPKGWGGSPAPTMVAGVGVGGRLLVGGEASWVTGQAREAETFAILPYP
jgi:hypothetical protein